MIMNRMKYDPAMLSALKNADNFMLCTHIHPDGDAIGSMLAAGRLLRALGKTVAMVCPDEIPHHLDWLPDVGLIVPVEAAAGRRYDAAMCVDVAEARRIGTAWPLYESASMRFVVDHHPGEPDFAQFSVVDASAAAAGELICELWSALGVPLDQEAAAQLYAAISTDTGNFMFSSVTARTFACMEAAMAAGLDISEASRKLFLIKSRPAAAALGRALSSLRYFADGRATSMHLSQADMWEIGAKDGDLHGIVNQGLYLEGVEMAFMADETPEGWKISLRGMPGRDVSRIARQFGGGGHRLASGCVIPGSYEEVERRLVAAMEEALRA